MTRRPNALVLTTDTAAGSRDSGATLRAAEVAGLVEDAGFDVVRTPARHLRAHPGPFDLGVAVSYACAPAVRGLRRRCTAVWLDAVDSWRLVDGSSARYDRSYLLRAVRDAARLSVMATPDLVTWISADDRARDGRSVRGRRRLVLPGIAEAPVPQPAGRNRRVVLAGDWHYPPNADGLAWFASSVLPHLVQGLREAGVAVHVFGHGAPALPVNVVIEGHAADPGELYRDGDVHVAPVRFGGGVKRKVLTPLLCGLPVVTTHAGAHGLRTHEALDVTDDPAAFARCVLARLAVAAPAVRPAPGSLADRDDTAAVLAWLAQRAGSCA